jgi:hypothetical protein
MQTSFANELHNGRDLYPTDLPSAVLKTSRWMVSGKVLKTHCAPSLRPKAARIAKEIKTKISQRQRATLNLLSNAVGVPTTVCLHASNSRKPKPSLKPQPQRRVNALPA